MGPRDKPEDDTRWWAHAIPLGLYGCPFKRAVLRARYLRKRGLAMRGERLCAVAYERQTGRVARWATSNHAASKSANYLADDV